MIETLINNTKQRICNNRALLPQQAIEVYINTQKELIKELLENYDTNTSFNIVDILFSITCLYIYCVETYNDSSWFSEFQQWIYDNKILQLLIPANDYLNSIPVSSQYLYYFDWMKQYAHIRPTLFVHAITDNIMCEYSSEYTDEEKEILELKEVKEVLHRMMNEY